jgi:DNA-binding CsgD family transcriptional regulator
MLMSPPLTKRQVQILRHMLAGQRNDEIALALGMKSSSVSMHIVRVRRRVGVRTIIQLGAYCERHGIREAGATSP